MNGYLLDTNVPSETLRLEADDNVSRWIRTTGFREVHHVSVITLGEIRRGAALLPPSTRRTKFENFLETTVSTWFGPRVLSVTQSIAERWGKIDAARQRAGRPLNLSDGLIAATAIEHDLVLVTRNTKDFELLGLNVLNPWQAPKS